MVVVQTILNILKKYTLIFHFDDEAWKRDARMDGRGHSLATYDGHEHYETVDGDEFYIYRIN